MDQITQIKKDRFDAAAVVVFDAVAVLLFVIHGEVDVRWWLS